jgi:2-oxoacid:acceptor oxidoreductase gamma subunit (pyruvate/2-ketoisovalerate family)
MKEIRWHGRGGQGAVIAARVLAASFVREKRSAIAFPKFGFERRGAPVVAFTQVDDVPIRRKTQIYYPDCLIVIDPRLMQFVDVFEGVKENGVLVLDAFQPVKECYHKNIRVVGFVDATKIAMEQLGRPITNTCMLGAFARTTGWLRLDSILSVMEEYFADSVLQRNIGSVKRGYEETKLANF